MGSEAEALNRFLVEVFHEILKTEEACVASHFRDLSLRELHLIEEVCLTAERGGDNRATAIAAAQRVTAGTLTTVATQLEKKGYLVRRRDETDRRVVRILPTDQGLRANALHAEFHGELVAAVLDGTNPQEAQVFVKVLGLIERFFKEKETK